jgi:diadenylate cyclase
MTDLWSEIVYIFQRMNWLSILDVFLVAAVVFAVLLLLRDTQIMILLRGVIVIIVLLVLLTTLINLPGFTWLVNTIVPALMFAIPVIFAPETAAVLKNSAGLVQASCWYAKPIPRCN